MLTLSTRVVPARKFTVDGEEYEILGLDHLSREDEALVTARFSKYSQTAGNLSIEENLTKGTELALSLRKQRTAILTQLTTLPKDVADKLPTRPAIALIEAIQKEMEGEGTGDEDDEPDTEEETGTAGEPQP